MNRRARARRASTGDDDVVIAEICSSVFPLSLWERVRVRDEVTGERKQYRVIFRVRLSLTKRVGANCRRIAMLRTLTPALSQREREPPPSKPNAPENALELSRSAFRLFVRAIPTHQPSSLSESTARHLPVSDGCAETIFPRWCRKSMPPAIDEDRSQILHARPHVPFRVRA